MSSLEVTLLGNFQVHSVSGTAIDIPGRKVALLLAFLALPCGKAHTRDELIGLLWGTRSESQARGSLRHALWTLRKCFEGIEPSPLAVDGDTIVFGADGGVEVDAAAFEKLAGESTPDALQRAADLYGGELLAGFGPREPEAGEWLFQERQRLADLARRTLERLMDHQAGERLLDQATVSAHRLLAMDRLSENAHRCLMRICMDDYSITALNDPFLDHQDSYTQTDVRLSWVSAEGKYNAELFITNIEDNFPKLGGFYAFGGMWIHSGPEPQMYGLKFGVTF